MKSYIFQVEIEQEEDGRWSADIPALPGCAAWGYSQEEALEAIQDTAKAYLEVLFEDGRPLPKEAEKTTQVIEAPVVAVTL
jgi:predicted RNase H-like HicB family nuclease